MQAAPTYPLTPMDTNAVYQRAWARLLERIESKTSWGRNALKDVMLDCLVNATDTFLVLPQGVEQTWNPGESDEDDPKPSTQPPWLQGEF